MYLILSNMIRLSVPRGDDLRHLVKPGEVARLALGRQRAADAGHVDGDVTDGHPARRASACCRS